MTTIHLTDAQRDTFAACGLIVIDGELVCDGSYDCAAPTHMLGCFKSNWRDSDHGGRVAPAGWTTATEPCDTCGGREVVFDPSYVSEAQFCPDCVGGRRVVTLTATCPDPLHDTSRKDGGWAVCKPGACDSGVVTLGRFTIPALLPVVRYFTHGQIGARVNTASPEDGPFLVYLAHDPNVNGADAVEMSVRPRPGQFIAKVERVQ